MRMSYRIIRSRPSTIARGGGWERHIIPQAQAQAFQGTREPSQFGVYHGEKMILRKLLMQMAGVSRLALDHCAARQHRLTPIFE